MITLKEWVELVDYKITEGSEFYNYAPNMFTLTSWNGNQDGYSTNIVFDVIDQTVYAVEMCDYKNNRAYRLKLPEMALDKKAWDGVNFIDLETDEDFLAKARAIIAGEEYDERVVIPLELDDDILYTLMKKAHERDMTFNDFMNEVLMIEIERMVDNEKISNDSPN